MLHPRLSFVLACLLALLAANCAGTEDAGPGDPALGRGASAIIGGVAANQSQIYSVVALTDATEGLVGCSGILLAPTVVVTAAHCVYPNDDPSQPMLAPSALFVVAGGLDPEPNPPTQPPAVPQPQSGEQLPVANIIANAYTTSAPLEDGGLSQENDIAILLLSKPATLVTPIPTLPFAQFDSSLTQGMPMTINGYGIHDLNTQFKGVLYIAQAPYQFHNPTELLVGGPGSPDSCTDDSGGPAYVSIGGTMYVAGVLSRSAVIPAACGQGSVYTILSAYDSWLSANSNGAYSPSGNGAGGTTSGGGTASPTGPGGCACKVGESPINSLSGVWMSLGLMLLAAMRRRSRVDLAVRP